MRKRFSNIIVTLTKLVTITKFSSKPYLRIFVPTGLAVYQETQLQERNANGQYITHKNNSVKNIEGETGSKLGGKNIHVFSNQ